MRIKGFLSREYDPPAPFVRAWLTSEELGISKFIDFHIDTGASSTIILDKDFNYLKLNVSDLKKAERNICGIGGLIDTYIIADTIIIFKSEDGTLYKERTPILVGVHKLDKLTNEEKKIIARLPSLLGRNILRKFKLVYKERSNEVYIEK